MNKLADLEKKLADITCPSCLYGDLELHMRCDLGFWDCLYQAKCRHCGFSFDVDTDTRTFLETYPEVQKRLRETGCPNCGSIKLELSMRCEMANRHCFYVATCDICHYSFRWRGMTGPLPALPE